MARRRTTVGRELNNTPADELTWQQGVPSIVFRKFDLPPGS